MASFPRENTKRIKIINDLINLFAVNNYLIWVDTRKINIACDLETILPTDTLTLYECRQTSDGKWIIKCTS